MLPVFTHHQKTVVVDAEIAGSDKRRLVGFIGGVDLTDGRFDTPEFPLFRYQETHGCEGEDFYQARRIRRRDKPVSDTERNQSFYLYTQPVLSHWLSLLQHTSS